MTNPIESLDKKVEDHKEKGMRHETRFVSSYKRGGFTDGHDVELLVSSKGRYILHCVCGGTTYGAVDSEKRFVIECLGGPDPFLLCGLRFDLGKMGYIVGSSETYCLEMEIYSVAEE